MTNDTRTMEIGMPFFGDNDHFPDDFFLSTFLWNRLQTLLRLFVFVTTSFSDVAMKKSQQETLGVITRLNLQKSYVPVSALVSLFVLFAFEKIEDTPCTLSLKSLSGLLTVCYKTTHPNSRRCGRNWVAPPTSKLGTFLSRL